MLGSEFVAEYEKKGALAWEAAALEMARRGELTPWPWVDLPLSDGEGNTAVLPVQSDVVSVGSIDDHVRLPLLPQTAQSIANLAGALLPTPWLDYQIWRASSHKLTPTAMVPNRGADLRQYAEHSALVDGQLAQPIGASAPQRFGEEPDRPITRSPDLISGHKKSVVVSNLMLPGKVVIFGWYRPSPPYPDVFDDHQAMQDPDRQPIQPLSNVHGAFYVDYSHGIRLVSGSAILNGQPIATVDLYQHPTLWRLVSHEGPLRAPRYPSPVAPVTPRPVDLIARPAAGPLVVPRVPGIGETGVLYRRRDRRNW